jgi:hypothetical protein
MRAQLSLRLTRSVRSFGRAAGARFLGRSGTRRSSRESGYTFLIALFMIVAIIIASDVALRNMASAGRRQREQEEIWRGNQYIRAIRLYYRKTGMFPRTIDDLQKGQPQLHFLRAAAYKDPMNTDDGAWGFIYITGAGQLIGSSKYTTLQEMALIDLNNGQLPTALQGNVSGASNQGATFGAFNSQSQAPAPAQTPGQTNGSPPPTTGVATSTPGAPAASPFGTPGQAAATTMGQTPTGPVDGPVLGGFIVGVVSKSPRESVKVYKGGKKYTEWEFIWNPLEDQAQAMQNGLAPQGAQPGQPGLPIANPNGISPIGPDGGIGNGGAVIPPSNQSSPSQNPAPNN